MNDRVPAANPVKAGARCAVIVDHPASLKVGIDRDGTDVLEAAPFQVFADPSIGFRAPGNNEPFLADFRFGVPKGFKTGCIGFTIPCFSKVRQI